MKVKNFWPRGTVSRAPYGSATKYYLWCSVDVEFYMFLHSSSKLFGTNRRVFRRQKQNRSVTLCLLHVYKKVYLLNTRHIHLGPRKQLQSQWQIQDFPEDRAPTANIFFVKFSHENEKLDPKGWRVSGTALLDLSMQKLQFEFDMTLTLKLPWSLCDHFHVRNLQWNTSIPQLLKWHVHLVWPKCPMLKRCACAYENEFLPKVSTHKGHRTDNIT